VHPGLDLFLLLGEAAEVALADRAGHRPPNPARVFQRPQGDVEVEGPHRHQHAQPVGAGNLVAFPVGAEGQALLPVLGHLRRQAEAADAGVMLLDVGPERAGQPAGQALQRAVVQARAAFVQIGNERVPGGTALELVAVHQLAGRQLPPADRTAQRQLSGQHAGITQQVPRRVQAERTSPPFRRPQSW